MTHIADPRDSRRRDDVRPTIPLPRARLTGTGIVIGCAILGASLFLILDSSRRAPRTSAQEQNQGIIASPPPLEVPLRESAAVRPAEIKATQEASLPVERPQSIYAPPPAAQVYAPSYAPPPPPVRPARQPSSAGDILQMDISPGDARVTNAEPSSTPDEKPAGDDQAVRASIIRNRATVVAQGTLIAATLETPVHSSRSGLTRAVVSQDIRGFDGSRILIPRGSRLVGETQGGTQVGQKRVFITWTRLVRPDGVAIRIGSPGADRLGGGGLPGRVNSHFLERFGNAVLQSALQIGINRASRSATDSVILALPGQAGGTISQLPIFNAPTGPSISIGQGSEISIFVARDLDFSGIGGR